MNYINSYYAQVMSMDTRKKFKKFIEEVSRIKRIGLSYNPKTNEIGYDNYVMDINGILETIYNLWLTWNENH